MGLRGETATRGEIKRVFLAVINGANAERVSREALGGWRKGAVQEFAAEIGRIRKNATAWFPEIATEVRRNCKDASEWRIRSSTVYFAMVVQEDIALTAIEEAAARCGLSGDAPTGDGLLVRLADDARERASVHKVLCEASKLTQARIGFPLQLGVKSLEGAALTAWPWEMDHGPEYGSQCIAEK